MADFSRDPREHWLKPRFSKNEVADSGYTKSPAPSPAKPPAIQGDFGIIRSMQRRSFLCLYCGTTGAYLAGSALLCARCTPDPDGDVTFDGVRMSKMPAGICPDCLKMHTMDELTAAPEVANLLVPQLRDTTLLTLAEAKDKLDPDFCLEDYVDEAGLLEIYEMDDE